MGRPKEPVRPSSAKGTIERVFHPSTVKNKLRRQEIFQKLKQQKSKEKRETREKRKKEREELGDEAPPKQEPKTIENTRVIEETLVLPDDEEVIQDTRTDELATYFVSGKTPKILMFASRKPSLNTALLLRELQTCVPNSEVRDRMHVELKKIIPEAVGRDFTDIIVIHEDRKEPSPTDGLLLIHLPDGPTAHFKLTNFRRGYDIKGHGKTTSHRPEIVLNHFGTRLGHTLARMLAALFPHDPQFQGRRVVTFHNQRDYIFFRHHRYIFKNAQKVGLQEIGPRFTLKLRSLQKGTFDTKFGQYIWVHKRKQMDTSRRRFHL